MKISYMIHSDGVRPIRRNTKRTGTLSEIAVAYRFARLGFRASVPVGEEAPYDLIVESPDNRLFRIQVKTGRLRRGVLMFDAVSSHRHRKQPATRYDGKIDAFAIYCPSNDECYLIGVNDAPVQGDKGHLRIEPTRNNMQRGVHWAKDYLMDANEAPKFFSRGAEVEPLMGIEPMASSLPMTCSTTELQGQ